MVEVRVRLAIKIGVSVRVPASWPAANSASSTSCTEVLAAAAATSW